MVLTDDTVTAILDTMKDTMKETMDKMIEFQNENAKLNREMLERILSNQQTSQPVNKPATTKQLEQAGKSQSLAEDSIGDKVDETDDANEDADDKKFNGPLFPQDDDDRYAESYNRQFGDFGMPPRNNAPKPVRPEIKEGCGEFGWQLFLDRWQRYKKTAKLLTTSEICLELRNACHENVDKLLFEFVGAKELNSTRLTEKALLDHIKHVAVGSTHKDYERWKFNQICQQEGEPVTKFVARLKAQALLCDFNIHVSAGNTKVAHSYAEDMISQRLTSGVINPEHREKLLSEAPNMKSLKEKVDKLMSLEATEQVSSKFQMSSPTISAPGRSPSQFKRFKNQRRFTADDCPSRRGRSVGVNVYNRNHVKSRPSQDPAKKSETPFRGGPYTSNIEVRSYVHTKWEYSAPGIIKCTEMPHHTIQFNTYCIPPTTRRAQGTHLPTCIPPPYASHYSMPAITTLSHYTAHASPHNNNSPTTCVFAKHE